MAPWTGRQPWINSYSGCSGEGRGEWRLAVVNSDQRTPLPRLRGRWQIGTGGARTAARSATAVEPLPSSPIFSFSLLLLNFSTLFFSLAFVSGCRVIQ
ncbi:hypothetical protein SESBI_25591 [Sesbania bispinosa]|nr:hypothetical protein SESBI_25591 [Sesbania bispinosa]